MNVVMQCYHDYDDAWATPILATPNREKADALVEEMRRRLDVQKSAMDTVILHMKHWEVSNPRPVHKPPKEKGLPDYGGRNRSKWSPEQIAEYKSVKQSNQDAQSAAIQPLRDWAIKRLEAENAFKATLPQQVQDDLQTMNDKNYWEVEEVPYED
jgi:hypothetical protein